VTQADLNAGSVTNHATASAGGTTSNQAQATVNAVQTKALTLVKKATESSYSAAGAVLHYTFEVTNSGNVRLAGPVVVADDKSTNESCPNVNTVGNNDGFLDPGEKLTCTATYTVTQADVTNGSVTNHATASADGTTSNQATATVPLVAPGKLLTIGPSTMEGSLSIKPGDWISAGYHFKINVKNHAATTETVTGPAPGGFPQITMAVTCVGGPFNGQTKNIVFGLTKPGQSYSVAAGYTGWTPPDAQDKVGVFQGSFQAPDLCGGAVMKNTAGAKFQAAFSQSPQVGITTVQFHYRVPNAKGKGNFNCADPTVNNGTLGGSVCGASWSPTVDP